MLHYCERLNKLEAETLEMGRLKLDLVMYYNILTFVSYSMIIKVVLIFLVLQINIYIVIRYFWICKVDILVAFVVIETLHVTV